jgi:hypothetical protein
MARISMRLPMAARLDQAEGWRAWCWAWRARNSMRRKVRIRSVSGCS